MFLVAILAAGAALRVWLPFRRRSCLPLPALDLGKRVGDSPERSAAFNGIPAVRIFEVVQ